MPGLQDSQLTVGLADGGGHPGLAGTGAGAAAAKGPHLGAPLIVIWDGLNTHRSRKMCAFTDACEDRLTVVQRSGFAPDLNAV